MIFGSDDAYVPDTPNFAIFFLLKCGTPDQWVRLWSGDGLFDLPADGFDTTGGRYTGLGFPVGLPAISQAINGAATSLDFTLSGVDATALQMVGAERHLVDGAALHLGVMDLDEHQQPASGCDWLLEARAGKPRVSRTGRSEGALRTITLPATTDFTDRNRAAIAWWSPASQRVRSPDDTFFDQTPAITAGMVISWPA